MTNKEKAQYEEPEALKKILYRELQGKKFRLSCGHHITFNETLGNNLVILNGKRLSIVCLDCGS